MDEGIARTALLDPEAGERFVSLRRPLGVTSFGIDQMVLRAAPARAHPSPRAPGGGLPRLEGTLTLLVEGEEEACDPASSCASRPPRAASSSTAGPSARAVRARRHGGHAGRDGQAWTDRDNPHRAPPQEVPLPEDLPVPRGQAAGGWCSPKGDPWSSRQSSKRRGAPGTPRHPRRPCPPRRPRARARGPSPRRCPPPRRTRRATRPRPRRGCPRALGRVDHVAVAQAPGSNRHPNRPS